MKGMVVSESAVTRKILRGVLYSAELSDIVLLTSGREGYDAIKLEDFDVVLLDNCLSDVPLLDLITTFRLQARRIAIFVFGAETRKDFVMEAIKAGATGFIVRPFKPPAVARRVKKALLERV